MEEEGVRDGDIYVAKLQNEDGSWSSSGFARVVRAGLRGQKGQGSELTWRAGGAERSRLGTSRCARRRRAKIALASALCLEFSGLKSRIPLPRSRLPAGPPRSSS